MVESPSDRLVGRSSTLSGAATAIPRWDSRRHVAGRFRLRPTRLAGTKDLHHLLGRQREWLFSLYSSSATAVDASLDACPKCVKCNSKAVYILAIQPFQRSACVPMWDAPRGDASCQHVVPSRCEGCSGGIGCAWAAVSVVGIVALEDHAATWVNRQESRCLPRANPVHFRLLLARYRVAVTSKPFGAQS
jgi:hypothetical protein